MTVHRAAHFARTSERSQTSLPQFVCFLSERPKFSLRHRLMRHAIQHRPAGNSAHVERKVPRVIREGRDLLHRFPKLYDGIRPMTVLATGVCPASDDAHAPGRPPFSRDNYETFIAQPPFGLKYQCRQGLAIKSAAAHLSEI